jgi:hypothetical protein
VASEELQERNNLGRGPPVPPRLVVTSRAFAAANLAF